MWNDNVEFQKSVKNRNKEKILYQLFQTVFSIL